MRSQRIIHRQARTPHGNVERRPGDGRGIKCHTMARSFRLWLKSFRSFIVSRAKTCFQIACKFQKLDHLLKSRWDIGAVRWVLRNDALPPHAKEAWRNGLLNPAVEFRPDFHPQGTSHPILSEAAQGVCIPFCERDPGQDFNVGC